MVSAFIVLMLSALYFEPIRKIGITLTFCETDYWKVLIESEKK